MHRASKRSGRISFVGIAVVCAAAFVGILFFLSGESPEGSASNFLSALAKGDTAKLADVSLIHKEPKDQVRKDWENTLKLSRSFTFIWQITSVHTNGDRATIKLDFTKDPGAPTSYAEHYELEMVKTSDGWKVDVPQISRGMYPFLPR